MGILEEALVAYTYVGVWISLSAGVILYNKYVLSVFGFPFPVALTMIHMAFCSSLARTSFCVKGCLNSLLTHHTPHTRRYRFPVFVHARAWCARGCSPCLRDSSALLSHHAKHYCQQMDPHARHAR